MSDHVLFHMWGPFRQSLIDGHLFYVEQAQKRLLSQFDNISEDADKAAEDWLERHSHLFDPDRHDPGEFDEAAYDHSIEFYGLLTDMQDRTRLSVVAGIFHEWDKQLREWLVREIGHWHQGDNTSSKVWSADFGKIADLLESFRFNVRCANYFHVLDACRLVVNVYKHGEGNSFEELKQKYPEYIEDPFRGTGALSDMEHRDYTHLKVSDDQFKAFSDAIISFWRDVPERVFESQITNVSDWLRKAILKDQGGKRQGSET